MRSLAILFLILSTNLFVQKSGAKTLTFEAFMDRVKKHHPLAKQADIQLLKGDANLRKYRGAFDPKAFSDVSQKYFKDQQYYSIMNSGLKIPTWYGLELQGGYEQNDGIFLNPADNTPGAGLWYAGLSVPLGQGLFIDQRRAELQQAKVYQKSTQAERKALYNELLYEAGKAYWDWFKSYNTVSVYQEAVTVAEQRFQAVKQGVSFGDRPAIDTTEARIQLQSRTLQEQEAQLDYKNATALLSVYLWLEGKVPLEVDRTTIPSLSNAISNVGLDLTLKMHLDSLTSNHPILQQSLYKINQLEINKRWKQEQLKPTLNVKYNAIAQPSNDNIFDGYSVNNYTFGLEFSAPIFLRKERGILQMAELKVSEAKLEFIFKQEMLVFKAKAALNDWETTEKQISLYRQTVNDYNRLLEGERRMFDAGESSLFMVNSRESGYIKAQLNFVELLAKNQKANLATNYAFGLLLEKK